MTNLLDDESLPNDVAGLDAEIALLEEKQKNCALHIKTLLQEEDLAAGICHAEAIHDAKRQKMLLQYQRDLRVAKRNRLLYAD